MRRCLVESMDWSSPRVPLPEAETHHLVHVLRVGEGETVSLFDGHGVEAPAVLRREQDGTFALELQAEPRTVPHPRVRMTLLQALPKGRRMDLIVEKATELGVLRVVPTITDRVVARPYPSKAASRTARWHRVAAGAAKQCQTPYVPEISEPTSYLNALRIGASADLFLVGALEGDPTPLKARLRALPSPPPSTVALLIGPEGDLTPSELAEARDAGAQPVSFGPLTLRVETAALYGIGAVLYELGDA
jgi:16S rRNA (uracil1498-N3)-methyltransferase